MPRKRKTSKRRTRKPSDSHWQKLVLKEFLRQQANRTRNELRDYEAFLKRMG